MAFDAITYDRLEDAEKLLGDKIDGIGTKVDNINSSVEGLEDAEKLLGDKIDGIGTKVDKINSSVEGLPTSLESDFTAVKEAISGVKTDVGNVKIEVGNVNAAVSNVKSDTSSIKQTIDSNPLFSYGSSIKLIQRGIIQNTKFYQDISITINNVNPEKCLVILNSSLDNNSGTQPSVYLKSLTSTTLIIHISTNGASGTKCGYSWQVIEFY